MECAWVLSWPADYPFPTPRPPEAAGGAARNRVEEYEESEALLEDGKCDDTGGVPTQSILTHFCIHYCPYRDLTWTWNQCGGGFRLRHIDYMSAM